jgi:hypothetical protein
MRLLTPDGLLLIETPDFDDRRTFEAIRASGARFLEELRPIEHIHLFSEPGLRLMLDRLGCHWVQSFRFGQSRLPFREKQCVVAGPLPLLERTRRDIEDGLASSPQGHMIQGLLDLQHYVKQTRVQLSASRHRAAEKMRLVYSSIHIPSTQRDAILIGGGWHQLESQMQETFRWVENDAELIIPQSTGTRQTLSLEVEPGPGVGLQPFTLQVLDGEGHTVTTAEVKGREVVNVTLPVTQGQSAVFRLHVEGGGLPAPNDPRILNFRIFRFGWSS